MPDLYDGLYPKDVNKTVRQDLNKTIIPITHGRALAVPNFFVEAKAPRGGADVVKRQACLDGAIGARAMHSLQTYGEEKPSYDGNAHAFSSTYHDGTLKMYTHHVTNLPPSKRRHDRGEWRLQVRHCCASAQISKTTDRNVCAGDMKQKRSAHETQLAPVVQIPRRQTRKSVNMQLQVSHCVTRIQLS